MTSSPRVYQEHRFPPELIGRAVWLYHRFSLSFRDVEDLLAERGIIVSYEAIRQWCGKFGSEYARRLKKKAGHRSSGLGFPRLSDTDRRSRAVREDSCGHKNSSRFLGIPAARHVHGTCDLVQVEGSL